MGRFLEIQQGWKRFAVFLGMLYLLQASGWADEPPAVEAPFGWQFQTLPKRGGTTRGQTVTLDKRPADTWEALQEPGLSFKERDRRAILAMSGEYRASFEFVEIAGFTPDYQPPAVYRSWGTEKVYVAENSPDRIVLQHVLVMKVPDKEPQVVKHWRQDWIYQPQTVLAYQGNDTWTKRPSSPHERQGAWAQEVYEVDDSPRYGGIGVWSHQGGISSWQSEATWRPLPRREHTVRNDYQVLTGINRHIITPTGWIHEQENNKTVLGSDGRVTRVLARELGINRYERLKDFDFTDGDRYWKSSQPFWSEVQTEWAERFRKNATLTLLPRQKRAQAMGRSFELARKHSESQNREASSNEIEALVNSYFRKDGEN